MNNRPLWKHQVEAIQMALRTPELYVAFEMGTGKTRTEIEIFRRRCAAEGRLLRTLILCPLIVMSNWRDEFLMYSKIKREDIILLRGSQKKRMATFQKYCTNRGVCDVPRIVVLNYDALSMEQLMEMIQFWQPEVLICDEAHTLKSHQSKRAKRLVPIADGARYKSLLSGTPILNSIEDIWMQFRILDRGETFGKNFYSFRQHYMQDKNAAFASRDSYFPKWEPRPEAYQELQTKMYRKTIRAKKADCLDLPPLIKQKIEVELSPEQVKMYNEMKKDFITWVQSTKSSDQPLPVVAQLAITKALRLQQIVTGFAKADNGETVWMSKNPRLDALMELLEPLVPEHKVIVWAVFKENYKMIAKRLSEAKIAFTTLTGEQSAQEKDEAMDAFRTDPNIRVMIANQAAGGVGVNLVEASYAIYFSKNFSLKDDLQSEARNYRGGSHIHEKVTRIDIEAPGTIDQLITESLNAKIDISNKVLEKDFWSKL